MNHWIESILMRHGTATHALTLSIATTLRCVMTLERRWPTVFATHSTHKLLNALSQASFIHIRNGRNAIDFNRFNQAYHMHATTSPLYAICASNDIAADMMDGNSGRSLTDEVIREAIDFRQSLGYLYKEFINDDEWFQTMESRNGERPSNR